MLVDIVKWGLDPAEIMARCGQVYTYPERLSFGVYHGFNLYAELPRNEWEDFPRFDLDSEMYPYGVVDSPEQFNGLVASKLIELPDEYVASLGCIRREDQPAKGGWCWDKWGPYLGNHKPEDSHDYEYLYDCTTIDEVWCYNIIKHLTP